MKKEDVLGVILARGGSKRLPGKNIALLNGKPLLSYTCAAAHGSKFLTRTVLSTDDDDIARIGRSCGAEVPFLRPAELARDDTPSMDVVRHVLAELGKREAYEPAIIVVLQPTSPLRTAEHIDAGIQLFRQTGADSVVGVVEIPHTFAPSMSMRVVEGKLTPAPDASAYRRRSTETFYALNGALYVLQARLLAGERPFGSDSRPLIMDADHSVDIDSAADLARVEVLLRTMAAQKSRDGTS